MLGVHIAGVPSACACKCDKCTLFVQPFISIELHLQIMPRKMSTRPRVFPSTRPSFDNDQAIGLLSIRSYHDEAVPAALLSGTGR
jgi:hypothetical protein